jgi:hypothetical protein
LSGIKEFERATMTRIGRCHIDYPVLGGQCIAPARQSRPAQYFKPNLCLPVVPRQHVASFT